MNINEHIVRLVGSASIPEPLENGSDYGIICDVGIYSEEDVNNQDGTFNKKYKAKLLGNMEIIPKGKSPIKVKVKGSTEGQQLRMLLLDEWRSLGTGESFEDYYHKEMQELIRNRRDKIE